MHTAGHNEHFHSAFSYKSISPHFCSVLFAVVLGSTRIDTPLCNGRASLRKWKTHKTQIQFCSIALQKRKISFEPLLLLKYSVLQ